MMNRRFMITGGIAALSLSGCGGAEPVWAPDALVEKMRYRHPGPPQLMLLTMMNVGSQNGAHTGLLINARERVLFDPAGSFKHPSIPERNDVIFGMSPQILDAYISYHSRETYYTLIQEIDVPAEVAEQAYVRVLNYGAVPKANCTRATSTVLRELPGFEHIKVSFFPDKLSDQFGQISGVRSRTHYETDSDDKSKAMIEIAKTLTTPN